MLEVGILKNFDSGTYKAGVQLAGSLTTYFDDISVARNIPSSALVIGNYVILAIPGGNPKDACVIATWPQGSPGGAEVHGNEYHDPDFATESALAAHAALTNPHSATPNATPSRLILRDASGRAKVAAPSASDDIARKADIDNLFNKSWYHEDWKSLDKWISTVTGSGGYDWYAPADLRLKTGATINSNSCFDTPQIGPLCLRTAGEQLYFKVQAGSALADSEIRLYEVRSDAAKPPSDTFRHIGWKIINGEIYASTADGTTEKATDTGINMAPIWTIKDLLIKCPATAVVEFYVDDVLKATHNGAADNVPDHHNGRFSFNIKNTAAADKQIAFYTFNWRT